MESALGVLAMLVFVAVTIAFAAGVTYAIVKISPTTRKKPSEPRVAAGEPPAAGGDA